MIKSVLAAAAATLAITAGAATLPASPAEAGVKLHINIGHYGYGHGYKRFARKPICHTEYRLVKVKAWGKYGSYWKWVEKPYTRCY